MEAMFTLRRAAGGVFHFARVSVAICASPTAEVVAEVDSPPSEVWTMWVQAAIAGARSALEARPLLARITRIDWNPIDSKESTVWCAAYIATRMALGDDEPEAVYDGERWAVRCADGTTISNSDKP